MIKNSGKRRNFRIMPYKHFQEKMELQRKYRDLEKKKGERRRRRRDAEKMKAENQIWYSGRIIGSVHQLEGRIIAGRTTRREEFFAPDFHEL